MPDYTHLHCDSSREGLPSLLHSSSTLLLSGLLAPPCTSRPHRRTERRGRDGRFSRARGGGGAPSARRWVQPESSNPDDSRNFRAMAHFASARPRAALSAAEPPTHACGVRMRRRAELSTVRYAASGRIYAYFLTVGPQTAYRTPQISEHGQIRVDESSVSGARPKRGLRRCAADLGGGRYWPYVERRDTASNIKSRL